jgi:hypothetical protein
MTDEAELEEVAELAPSEGEEALEVASEPVEAAVVETEIFEEPAPEDFVQQEEDSVEKYVEEAPPAKRPGFSKLFDTLAGKSGFYGNVVQMDPKLPTEPEEYELAEEAQVVEDVPVTEEVEAFEETAEAVEEPVATLEEPEAIQEERSKPEKTRSVPEGIMQTKLAEVRTKADEARAAKLRANAALYEGLSAAYDFALDAEENAEEYLKLVEAQGLKIQLRSPMKPVVKLAFDGMCDESTIAQLETVLAWALKHDLPRGTLAERIEAEGGLGSILNGPTAAAA